jgi:hypothetical protein
MIRFSIIAVLYLTVGLFFCGLLDEKEHPLLLLVIWPMVFVGGFLLALTRLAYRIGEYIGNGGTNHGLD